MAGHEADKTIYHDSYNEVRDQLVLRYSAWTQHQISLEAARIFRPRYKIDKASEKTEKAGLSEYEIEPASFILNEKGEIFYPAYGKTLEEMNQSWLKQRPHEYSLSEHQTSRLIQQAFQNGATSIKAIYGREGEDNRDIVGMDYDPITNRGVTKIKNTEENGKLHSFSEIQVIAKQNYSHLFEVKPADNIFILTDKPITASEARKTIHSIETVRLIRRTDPIQIDKPQISKQEKLSYNSLDSSKNRRDLQTEIKAMPRKDATVQLAQDIEQVTIKTLKDTRQTLLLLGGAMYEVVKKQKKKREKAAEMITSKPESKPKREAFIKKVKQWFNIRERMKPFDFAQGIKKTKLVLSEKVKQAFVKVNSKFIETKKYLVKQIEKSIIKPITKAVSMVEQVPQKIKRITKVIKERTFKLIKQQQEKAWKSIKLLLEKRSQPQLVRKESRKEKPLMVQVKQKMNEVKKGLSLLTKKLTVSTFEMRRIGRKVVRTSLELVRRFSIRFKKGERLENKKTLLSFIKIKKDFVRLFRPHKLQILPLLDLIRQSIQIIYIDSRIRGNDKTINRKQIDLKLNSNTETKKKKQESLFWFWMFLYLITNPKIQFERSVATLLQNKKPIQKPKTVKKTQVVYDYFFKTRFGSIMVA